MQAAGSLTALEDVEGLKLSQHCILEGVYFLKTGRKQCRWQ